MKEDSAIQVRTGKETNFQNLKPPSLGASDTLKFLEKFKTKS